MIEFSKEQQQWIDSHYVLLPRDANGVIIHVGDVLMSSHHRGTFVVEAIGGNGMHVVYYRRSDGMGTGFHYAIECTHYKPPTVEDVLREFALACEDAGNAGPDVERIASEFAERLQLREEGE